MSDDKNDLPVDDKGETGTEEINDMGKGDEA